MMRTNMWQKRAMPKILHCGRHIRRKMALSFGRRRWEKVGRGGILNAGKEGSDTTIRGAGVCLYCLRDDSRSKSHVSITASCIAL